MINRSLAIFTLSTWILVWSAHAERLNFRTFSVEDGLGQSQVYAVHQGPAGYLWVGTDGGGISRFDGLHFETFTDQDGLSDNAIYSISQDRRGRLLIGTAMGMTIYDGVEFHAVQAEHGLTDASVWAIAEHADGDLWLACEGDGLLRMSDAEVTRFSTRDGLPSDDVFHVMVDDLGRVWGSTWSGAFVVESGEVRVVNSVDGLASDEVRSVSQAADGVLWFATDSGVTRWDGEVWRTLSSADGLVGDDVWLVLPEADGALWVLTAGGVSRYDGRKMVNWTSRHGLPHRAVETVMRDREGNVWFGTGAGLTRYGGPQISSIRSEHGLEDSSVWGFWWDPDGMMWIGTESNLVRYDASLGRVLPPARAEEQHFTTPMTGDSHGRLWFGGEQTLFRREHGRYRNLSAELGLEHMDLLCVFEDSAGRFWLGTTQHGLFVIDRDQVVSRYEQQTGLLSQTVNCVIEDGAGRIWIGTDRGLNLYESGRLSAPDPDRSGVRRFVLDMVLDQRGTLWCATYGDGVIGYRPETGESVSVKRAHRLPHDAALSLALDREDDLWIGTNLGVARLDLETFYGSGVISIEPFGHEEGFDGVECNQGAMSRDARGRIWVGTIDGAFCIDPAARRANRVEPATHITGLRLFFEPLDPTRYAVSIDSATGLPVALDLPADANHLTFDFTGVSLTVPERVRFQFMLDGYDSDWSPTTEIRHASYPNLPPGDYTFLVKACNNHGLWNQEPASFGFSISAPWWRTNPFYAATVLLAALGIMALVMTRTRRTRRYQTKLEARIADRTRELRREKEKVDAVNNELEKRVVERSNQLAEKEILLREVHHRVKNNLQIVNSLLRLQMRYAGQSEGVADILTESQDRIYSMALVHQMLYRSEDIACVHFEDYVGALIHSVSQSYPSLARVDLRSIINDLSLDIDTAVPCGLIITELLSNALKHAFPDGSHGAVDVELTADGQHLRIAVRDDGVGLPDAFDIAELNSLGVTLVQTLTHQLKGELEVRSDAGTEFVVTVPIQAPDSAEGSRSA